MSYLPTLIIIKYNYIIRLASLEPITLSIWQLYFYLKLKNVDLQTENVWPKKPKKSKFLHILTLNNQNFDNFDLNTENFSLQLKNVDLPNKFWQFIEQQTENLSPKKSENQNFYTFWP